MNMQNSGQSAFKKFLKENRSLAVSIPVLVILLIVVIIVYSQMGNSQNQPAAAAAAINTDTTSQAIQILPDTERETNSGGTENQQKIAGSKSNSDIKDPFSGPVTLDGILVDEDGNGIAVIEANNKSYIVRKDDVLDNDMAVSTIAADHVILKEGNREVTLKLEKRNSSKTTGN